MQKKFTMMPYRFNATTEPTEEQLSMIMREAAEEAQSSNAKITALFFQRLFEKIDALNKNE